MSKFRKKPVVIEAFRWTGDMDQTEDPIWACDAIRNGAIYFVDSGKPSCTLHVETLEGTMAAQSGDWIIKGTAGELYPCKPDIFAEICEPVTGDEAGEQVRSAAEPAANPPEPQAAGLREATSKELDALADVIDGEVGEPGLHHMEKRVWRFVANALAKTPPQGEPADG